MTHPYKEETMMRYVRLFLENFEEYLCAILTLVFIAVLSIQVFMRYVLQGSISWSEEVSRYAFIWMMFLSASLASQKRTHIRVTAPLLLLPEKYRTYILMISDSIWVFFNCVVVYLSTLQVKSMFQFKYLSPSLQWSMAYIYMIIPIGFALMTVRIIVGYVRQFTGKEDGYKI
jgi:TRAP-type C4-dicarboxylate transport system permease small subunit